jgi:SH3-like domain-containing protein
MQRAQDLIKKKQYDKARAILRKIDDPRAREWLARIDKMAPAPKTRRRSGGSIIGRLIGYLFTIIVSIVLTSGVIAALVMVTGPARGGEGLNISFGSNAVADNITPTVTPIPRLGVVQSSQRVNVRSEPSTNAQALLVLDPGKQVEILHESEDGQWYRVRVDNNVEGWIAASLLDADPAPTTVADAGSTPTAADGATAEPTLTATAEVECTPAEAQSWYNQQRQPINQTRFLLFQVDEGHTIDAQTALNTVRANRAAFEAAEALPCVSEARNEYLVAFQASDNSFANTLNNFPNEANSERATASQRFAAANDLLTEKFEFEPDRNGCGVELWYAGVADQISAFITLTDGVTSATSPSETIRTGIFDLQDMRRNVDVAVPDCVATAAGHFSAAIDAAIALFQGVMQQDAAASSSSANTMVAERSAFLNEMQRLGVPVPINRE